MKKIISILILCASAALARVGDTPSQFENGKGEPVDPAEALKYGNGTRALIWHGPQYSHIGVFTDGRCIYESYMLADNSELMPKSDFDAFLQPYVGWKVTYGHKNKKGMFRMATDQQGNKLVFAYWYEHNILSVMTLDCWNKVFEEKNSAVTMDEDSSKTPNDCLVVATEIYGRLKTSAHWTKILAFSWVKDGPTKYHALVVFQPTETSNVYVYDNQILGGSYDTEAKSHEAQDILAKIQTAAPAGTSLFDPEWIE